MTTNGVDGRCVHEKSKPVQQLSFRQALSVGRLNTLMACRREAARLYADARRGNLPAADARQLASIIRVIAELIELGELEPRLRALEAQQP